MSGATLLVVFSAACFGSIPIAVTIAQRAGLPLLATLAWRFGIGVAALALVAHRALPALARREALAPLLVLGGMQALMNFVSLASLAHIPAATLSFLFYTYPGWIAVIAAVRGTERLTAVRAGALLLALAGIGIMVGLPGGFVAHPTGVALALASALIYAVYVPIVGGYGARLGTEAAALHASVGALVAFVLLGLLFPGATGGLVLPTGMPAWLAVLSLGVLSTATGFLVFLRGLQVIGPVRAGIVSTVEPFFAAGLGALLLNQPLTRATFLGGGCVAAAVVLLQLGGGRRATPTNELP